MTTDYTQLDFDGLVVESPRGDRLLALPIAVLEVLRYASVIQYRRGGRVYRMRIDGFLDNREGGQAVTVVRDEMQPDVNPSPSPTPPPAPGEGMTEADDPANIPIYVKRAGSWEVTHVTRAQYERYQEQGRLTQEDPGVILNENEGATDDDQH